MAAKPVMTVAAVVVGTETTVPAVKAVMAAAAAASIVVGRGTGVRSDRTVARLWHRLWHRL